MDGYLKCKAGVKIFFLNIPFYVNSDCTCLAQRTMPSTVGAANDLLCYSAREGG